MRLDPGRGGKSSKDCLLLIINNAIFQKTMMIMKHLFSLIGFRLFRGHVGRLSPPLRYRARAFSGRWGSGDLGAGTKSHLQDRSQEDGDPCQDEDDGACHSLFPGREEHSQGDSRGGAVMGDSRWGDSLGNSRGDCEMLQDHSSLGPSVGT